MIEFFVKKGVFRNANHAIWFLSSIGFFILILSWSLFEFSRLVLIFIPLIIHIPPIAASIRKVIFLKEKSEIYSKDCIWFNVLMVLFYLIIFVIYSL